jgi:hypothetical protein
MDCVAQTVDKVWAALNSGLLLFGGFLAGVIGVWFKHNVYDMPDKIKRDNQERLQKLYDPLYGHLKVNDLLWKDFKERLSELGVQNLDETTKDQDVLNAILNSETDSRKVAIKLWISAMEGVFKYNNESAERVILHNLSYLTPDDRKDGADFQAAYLEYLRHVGEFRSIFHRWSTAKDTLDMLIQRGDPSDFHPINPYPNNFSIYVKRSKDSLEGAIWP